MNKNNCIEIIREDYSFKVLDSVEIGLNYAQFWYDFTSHWEKFTLDCIKNLSNKNKSFLDIGAWIGPISLWASKFFKSVYAFEPDPIAFKYLKNNIELNSNNINIYNSAISNDNNSVPIFSRSGLGSSMTSMYTGDLAEGSVSGFSILDALKLDEFSLIKIDIEGGERLIIDSFCEAMYDNPVDLIFSFHSGFYANEEKDFVYIINRLLDVYSKFILENGQEINLNEISSGFTTVFCTKK